MHTKTIRTWIAILLTACLSSVGITGSETDALVQYASTQSDTPKGICSLPRAGEGQLALALAQSGWLVHAMDTDAANVATARKCADRAGLLGRSLYIEEGSPAAIPFADNYVNLLVISDATEANLATLSISEIVRVLVPGTGKALIGQAHPSAGKLSRARLETWSKSCAGVSVVVVENQQGLWAQWTKTPQPGAVAWTHRLYSPANNPVSTDTACTWPLMTQWLGRPYLVETPLALVAQGRLAAVRLENSCAQLEVHDVHNGLLLWRRQLPDQLVAARTSAMALFSNALYLAEKQCVLIFDPASGRETGHVDCSDLGAQVKWLAVQDGMLFAMAGAADKPATAHQTWKIHGFPIASFGKGQAIGAYDLSGAKWLWTQKEAAELLDEEKIGLNNGRLYYYVIDKYMVCRESNTGKVIWENTKVVDKVKLFVKGDVRGHVAAVVCGDKFVAIHKPGCGSVILSAVDGEPIWSASAGPLLFYKELLLCKNGRTPPVCDAATGKPSDAFGKKNFGSGCGMFTLSTALLCGQNGMTYDFKTDKSLADSHGVGPFNHKTPCLSGFYVTEGLVFGGSVDCVCGCTVRGMTVEAPASAVPQGKRDEPSLLHQATPHTRIESFAVDALDWPTFRANRERGNASIAKVAATGAIKWAWQAGATVSGTAGKSATKDPLESNHEPVQVTAAGNLVLVPGCDGSVTAIDLASGAVRWCFNTGGRLYAPPTLAEGRCYIGSGDGCVYCLDAVGGHEIWRYRVAPIDRRIMIYGDLTSTWPITGGVLVQNGVVYAAAGILDVDGSYVVALDARTGEAKWRNDTSGHLDTRCRTGVAVCGYPAIANGRLWIRSASYDLVTGECHPSAQTQKSSADTAERYTGLLERYTGIFAHTFLVTGGSRFFEDQYPVGEYGPYNADLERGNDKFVFLQLADDATGKFPAVVPWQRCRIMPAWDNRLLVALPVNNSQDAKKTRGFREEELVCWDVPRTAEAITRATAAAATNKTVMSKSFPRVPLEKEPNTASNEMSAATQQIWRVQDVRFLAVALTANAVVAAHGTPAVPDSRSKTTYTLTAYDRADGKVRWDTPLASEPLMDGVSVARDGSVLVRLLNGGLVCVH